MSTSTSTSSSAKGPSSIYTPIDPKEAYAKPPFSKQEQDWPGSAKQMDPYPDHGERSYKGFGRLKGQTAIVTGGDSGIGKAVCIAFAREGANVVVSYLNEEEDAKDTEKWVREAGVDCLLIPGDISTEQQCKKIIDTTVAKYGKIDILVNNAAFQGKAKESFEELDWERIEYTFKTNIIAMFALSKYAVPHMQPGSSIINTGSIQAYQPSASILDYATTKGAIVNFTKGLGQELYKKKGIRVNCVAPGPVWTPLVISSFKGEKNAQFGSTYPAGRPAQPAELAPPYVFLASAESKYVCGEILAVTGGEPTA